MPVPARRPSSQSAAETTGLKCAPETGPNSRISTASPNTVAVEFSSSCSPTSFGESCCGGDPRADHHGDQQRGADELGQQPPRQPVAFTTGCPIRLSAPNSWDSCCSASGTTR